MAHVPGEEGGGAWLMYLLRKERGVAHVPGEEGGGAWLMWPERKGDRGVAGKVSGRVPFMLWLCATQTW